MALARASLPSFSGSVLPGMVGTPQAMAVSFMKDLGFEITEEGKHYKVTYYGDGRYQTTYAKTPSDVRGGMNSAQQTINIVF